MCFQMSMQRQPDWLNRELRLKLRENDSITFGRRGRQQKDFKGVMSFCRESIRRTKAHLEWKLATGIQDKKKLLFYTIYIITGGGSKEFTTSKKFPWFQVEVKECVEGPQTFLSFSRGVGGKECSAADPDWRVVHHFFFTASGLGGKKCGESRRSSLMQCAFCM